MSPASATSAPASSASGSPVSASSVAAAPGMPADLPLRRDDAFPSSPGYGVWIALMLFAFAAFAFVRALKSGKLPWRVPVAGDARSPAPRVVAARQLTPQANLQVVQWNGKEFLLACTAHSVTVVDSRGIEGPAP
ncbi:flagellar biosynthetic protein FliO [Ramlibacter sp.]|uniref:flagellar biosynthetic protein FliO n=1 Tax=Ramlibacter sp. TaxID=1917967 RepID=UPI002D8008CF|nr:flagellar biosynthetic protein FliO [Ramlibacter sp.]